MSERIAVRVGELGVRRGEGTLMAVGVGSCVAIALLDPVERVGGLAHALLPEPSANGRPGGPGRFAATSVAALMERMVDHGAEPRRLLGWLFGGANMFSSLAPGGESIGARNVRAARAALKQARIPLRGEAVGGDFGRSIYFSVERRAMSVRSMRHAEEVFGV